MREINVSQITDVVERLCIEANTHLPSDVKCAIKDCRACEDWDIAKGVLDNIITNFEIADNENVPICQDTGMACVFLEIGQDVHLVGGNLAEAVLSPYEFDRIEATASMESNKPCNGVLTPTFAKGRANDTTTISNNRKRFSL